MRVEFVIFLTSLIPFPLTYVLNTQQWMLNPTIVLVIGIIVLTLLVVVPSYILRRTEKPEFILYVMSLFMFASMIDLIIALEADGILSEFMTFYLKEGEPYLWTPYGTMINYWDGTVHYSLCLWMLYCIYRRKSYRRVGLYWAGSIINSLLTLIPGSILGKFGIKWAILLNLPYLFVPVWIVYRLMSNRGNMTEKSNVTRSSSHGLFRKIVDVIFIVYFLYATIVDLLRGFIALGCQHELLQEYLYDHEPYINSPFAYSKVQMILYLMYFIPYYCFAIYGIINPGQPWMLDWALIYAGAAAQGQFTHIGGSIHPRTEPEFLVPPRPHSQQIFGLINITLFIIPQLFAFRTYMVTPPEYSSNKKSRKIN